MTRNEKVSAIRNRRAVAKATGRRLPKKKKPPRQLYPHGIEREYERELLGITAPLFIAIEEMIKRDLTAIIAAKDQALKTDDSGFMRLDASYGEMIGRVFDGIRINVAAKITKGAIEDTAKTIGSRVSKFNADQVDRQFSAVLGIPVLRQERWLADKLTGFVAGNVSLIKGITDHGIADISSLVMTRVEAGDSNATIAKAIEERLGAVKRRARFIARDQVAKLNGKLTELRQRQVGVSEYIWRAVTDGATRADHLKNNGKKFSWEDPPDTGHPGEDYQCRCTAEPVLEEFMALPMQKAA